MRASLQNDERLPATIRFRDRRTDQRRADSTALELRQDRQRRQGENVSTRPIVVDEIGPTEHHEADNPIIDPGDEGKPGPVPRGLTDRRNHPGDLRLISERPPYDIRDGRTVARLLGPDHHITHDNRR